jgi:MFS family permease
MHNDTVEMNVFLSSSKYDSSDNDNDKSVFSLSDLWSLTKSQKFMIRAGLIISWGGFVYGYDIGVIAGTLRQIEDKFQLNDYETGLVVGLLPVGSIFGCMFGGPLCDYVGRWRTIIILNIIYIFGTLIIATASNVWHIYIGRYVIGIATALSGIADVPFLNEMSPPEYRGALCSTYELMAMLGILFAFLITWLVSELNSGDNDWRILYIFPAIFAVMQVLAMVYLPESPKWLITKNLDTEAKKSLSLQLNDSDDLDSKFQEMKLMVHNHNIAESRSRSSFLQTCYLYRIPFICIIILAFFQQFTGGVLVRNYAPRIFENAGFGLRASQLFTILLGVIKVGCCILSMIYVSEHYYSTVLLCYYTSIIIFF